MESSLARQNQASTQLAKHSQLSPSDKLPAITKALAKLGIRRQAKLSMDDYLVMAEDLMKFNLGDIEGGLDDIGNRPRSEGQTAFPDVPTMKNAVIERRIVREAAETRKREAGEAKYRSEHPEEFISVGQFWGSEDVKQIMSKAARMPSSSPATPRFSVPAIHMSPEEIMERVRKEKGEL